MKIKIRLLAIIVLLFALTPSYGNVNPEKLNQLKENIRLSAVSMDCQPAVAQYDLEINNVRARLLTGGDLWWNLQEGRYIVPKPAPGFPEVSAIFASGLWIGGVDPNGALKLAGVTYRQGNATDFYSGPLDENGETNAAICNDWDRHFVVKGENILKHNENYRASIENSVDYPCATIPNDVKYWPAKGNPFFSDEFDFELPVQNLADFFDMDGDGLYNPCSGDYPTVNQRGCEDLKTPDEIVFWMFNDNGGPHRLSQATAIQLEIQAEAFAYISQDELNDMTFYKFEIINKATDDIRDCYFGLWVDFDLGCSEDDYIGCDVSRSLAYVYNEDAADGSPGTSCPGGVETYGLDIPMVGIDLFRGPRGPKVFCGVNSDGSKILCDPPPGSGEQDTLVELGMTSFTYQNRGVSNPPESTQDPNIDFEFYNILKGQWKDGTAITFGNSGFDPASIDTIHYVFPASPDDDTGWSMCTANLPFEDRRTVQSTGPLMLQPGARNEMIFGVVYAADVDYPCPSIAKLQFADDLAQSLFDNCFSINDGPDAPDMIGIEMDQELILILSNDTLLIESNNAKEQYMEKDFLAPAGVGNPYYRFEGYIIYQLANANVSIQELEDLDKARIIHQVDVKNGVGDIYNWFPVSNPDPTGPTVWVPERQVIGGDEGIQHSFKITRDQFSNNQGLENGKDYYFTVVAYAYNNWMQYDVNDNIGQRKSYLQGRRNVLTYKYTPRALQDIDIPTTYGEEVAITRIEGIGTSFNNLDMADGEMQTILDGSFDGEITYNAGNGPINPKVVNPLGVKDGRYRLEITGDYDDASKVLEEGARWKLTNLTSGEVIASDKSIEEINEQIIHGKGFSLQVNQSGEPGERFDEDNGAIAQVHEYEDSGAVKWWNGIPAYLGTEVIWEDGDNDYLFSFVDTEEEDDPNNALSMMGDGFFIPFKSANWRPSNLPYITPAWKGSQGFAIAQNKLRLQHLNNVDIVFTSDKSKWSKCVVVESAVPDYLESGLSTVGSKTQFDLRADASIDENGNEINGQGMSYFPGYAIDVETGERLNIFFGENSVYNSDNDALVSQASGQSINSENIGADMIWNPSTELFIGDDPKNNSLGVFSNILGGQHYVYVTRQEYDGCASLAEELGAGGLLKKINAVSFITWTAIPVPKEPLLSLEEGLIPSDLTIKLRVTNPFNRELDIPNLNNPASFEAVGTNPVYEFGFEGVEVTGVVSTEEAEPLNKIGISPNPFNENLNNVVRITNLQRGSVVTVFSIDGKFIRRFEDGTGSSFMVAGQALDLEWNLRDSNGARIANGIYIFHIAMPRLGIQKAINWIKL